MKSLSKTRSKWWRITKYKPDYRRVLNNFIKNTTVKSLEIKLINQIIYDFEVNIDNNFVWNINKPKH